MELKVYFSRAASATLSRTATQGSQIRSESVHFYYLQGNANHPEGRRRVTLYGVEGREGWRGGESEFFTSQENYPRKLDLSKKIELALGVGEGVELVSLILGGSRKLARDFFQLSRGGRMEGRRERRRNG